MIKRFTEENSNKLTAHPTKIGLARLPNPSYWKPFGMTPTTTLPSFPEAIEDWWWNQAVLKWPEYSKDKLLNEIRREIVEQSDRFNKTRSFDSSSYGSRDLSILSYGNFFFPRTWQAMAFALSEAYFFRNWKTPRKGPLRILDLGSGSGASGLACLFLLRKWGLENPISLEAWDYSGKSLATMKNLHQSCTELWSDSKIFTTRKDLRYDLPTANARKFDLILLGFSLNEIQEAAESKCRNEWLKQVIQHLKPGGFLIMMEPAGSDSCMNLQEDSLMLTEGNSRLNLHAPYFNGMPCPFFAQKSKYYSHEVRTIKPTQTVQKINSPLHLEIREVKFGLSILSKAELSSLPPGHMRCRLVSPVRKRKGTISFIGIGSDGKEYRYELQRRDLNKDESKNILFLERGDVLEILDGSAGKDDSHIRLHSPQSIKLLFAPRVR